MSINLNLDRLQQLVQHLPKYTRPTIHIVGTNGKGSVSAYLSYILASSRPPLKVGRYNSPHLLVVHDCITIGNKSISAHSYAVARSVIEEADKQHGAKLTPFELLTLTAFHIFEEEKVDVAVVEAGMGGRLDATNILPTSVILASALTAVDLDHQAFLGPTVGHIAREKASVARPGRPFIIGRQKYKYLEVVDVVRTVAREQGGILLPALDVLRREWDPNVDREKPFFSLEPSAFKEPPHQPISCRLPCFNESMHSLLPLFGNHQLENLGVALGVVSSLFTHTPVELVSSLDFPSRITLQSVADGIRATSWLGRLSFHTIKVPPPASSPDPEPRSAVVIVDGAHNPASAQTLSDYLTHVVSTLPRGPKRLCLTYILSLSHSPPKTPTQTLSPLIPFRVPVSEGIEVVTRVALLRFTLPEGMPWIRSVSPYELRDVIKGLAPNADIRIISEDEEARGSRLGNEDLVEALKWAVHGTRATDHSLVVLAGSLYLVADFYRAQCIRD